MNYAAKTDTTGLKILTARQVTQYWRDGWLRLPKVMNDADLQTIDQCCQREKKATLEAIKRHAKKREERDPYVYSAGEVDTKMFYADFDLRLKFHELRSLVTKLGNIARDLLHTSDIRILHDKTFDKAPAKDGSRQTFWHQDLPFLPLDRRGLLTFWIPMQDVTAESGALRFVPGSHRVGPLGRVEVQPIEPTIEEILSKEDIEIVRDPVTVSLTAGDLTVHDGLTLHGSCENLSASVRRVWTCVFMPGATLWNGAPLSHENWKAYNLKPFQPFDHPDLMVD